MQSHSSHDGGSTNNAAIQDVAAASQKSVRSRKGCFECRRRKVKCDEKRPLCGPCDKGNRACQWPRPGDAYKNKPRSCTLQHRQSASDTSPDGHGSPQLPGALGNDAHDALASVEQVGESFSPTQISYNHLINTGENVFLGYRPNGSSSVPGMPPTSFSTLQQILPAHVQVQVPNRSVPVGPDSDQAILELLHQASHSHFPFVHPGPISTSYQGPLGSQAQGPNPAGSARDNIGTTEPSYLATDPVEELLSGEEFSDVLMAPGRQAELLAEPSFLAPYLPRVSDRLVMRHYLLHSTKIIMAHDSPRHTWNPWVSIHAPAAFKSLPGADHAVDALRTALLAIGAVHMRYGSTIKDALGAWKITYQARAQVWAHVKRTSVWQSTAAHQQRNPQENEELDVILAALLGCTIASSLAADDLWHEFLMAVCSFIERLGGLEALLEAERHSRLHASKSRSARMSLRRFCLEQLATREVFGCMSTDLAPRLLTPEFTASFVGLASWSSTEYEWESVERMFGISRLTIITISKACRLLAVVRQNDYEVGEDRVVLPMSTIDPATVQLRLPARAMARLADSPRLSTAGVGGGMSGPGSDFSRPGPQTSSVRITTHDTAASERDQVQRDANALLRELTAPVQQYSFTLSHPRTAAGNHIYRHTLRLRLLREVFRVPRSEERVQDAVKAIMEIAKEVLACYGRIVWMTWPILIAGFSMRSGDPSRPAALQLLCEFEPHACFDNAAACRALLEFWRYSDASADDLLPTEVFRKLESRPFLD